MWRLLQDTELLDRPANENGDYDMHVHLINIAFLLGQPPRERHCSSVKLNHTRFSATTKKKGCDIMKDFWGGPFFDDRGMLFRCDA